MIIFSTALKRIFKSKVRFILIMLCPFIYIGFFTFQTHRAATIGIVDYDNSTVSRGVYNLLNNSDGIKLVKISEDEIYDLTASYVIDYAVLIDKGFEENMFEGKELKIREYYIEDKQKLYFIRNSLSLQLDNYSMLWKAADQNKSKFEAALAKYDDSKLQVSSNMERLNDISQSRASMGFLVQFMLYMAVLTTGLILEDKTNGTYFRTFYGPISIRRYTGENLLAFFVTAVIQSLGIILALKLVFRAYLGSNLPALVLLFVIFSFVCISMGLFITSILKKPIHAYVAIAVITTPLIMLGGCYWGFNDMSDALNKIGQFIPVSWVMKTVDSIFNGSVTTGTLFENYGILMLFAVIFLASGLAKKVDISK